MQQAGNDAIWDEVWNRYQVATGSEKSNLEYCLAWTDKKWLIDRLKYT
jgi:hypothetical protein